jgi:hypothetical protein
MEIADAPQDKRIGEMPVHKMKFVVVNNMTPRAPCVCVACSRPLERGYLHDLSTSERYCGIACYPQMDGGEWIGRIDRSNEPIRTRRRLAEADR